MDIGFYIGVILRALLKSLYRTYVLLAYGLKLCDVGEGSLKHERSLRSLWGTPPTYLLLEY